MVRIHEVVLLFSLILKLHVVLTKESNNHLKFVVKAVLHSLV